MLAMHEQSDCAPAEMVEALKRRIRERQWRRQVDAWVWRSAGVSLDDLPDVPLADWFEEGVAPRRAARLAIERALG